MHLIPWVCQSPGTSEATHLSSAPSPPFPPCSSSPLFMFFPSLPAEVHTSNSEAEDVLKKCESIFVSVRVQQRLCLFSEPASTALPLSVLCIPGSPDPHLLSCAGGNLLLRCTALNSSSQWVELPLVWEAAVLVVGSGFGWVWWPPDYPKTDFIYGWGKNSVARASGDNFSPLQYTALGCTDLHRNEFALGHSTWLTTTFKSYQSDMPCPQPINPALVPCPWLRGQGGRIIQLCQEGVKFYLWDWVYELCLPPPCRCPQKPPVPPWDPALGGISVVASGNGWILELVTEEGKWERGDNYAKAL